MAISTDREDRVVCDGYRDGRKCNRVFNIVGPQRGTSPVQYLENIISQALACRWTFNRASGKIFCPVCSEYEQQ